MQICSGDACDGCGRRASKLKEAQPHDPVLLCETDFLSAGVVSSALEDAGIPFFKRTDGGAAVSVIVGNAYESDRIYVPFNAYYEAKNIADGILDEIDERDFENDIGDDWKISENGGAYDGSDDDYDENDDYEEDRDDSDES